MEKKYINRYRSFCSSLSGLEQLRGRDTEDEFVISGAVQKFSLTLDISWKVMKDILLNYHKLSDFAAGSPRETLRKAFEVGLIDDDIWMHMLDDCNNLTHDYDGRLAKTAVITIRDEYLPVFEQFRETAGKYINQMGM